MTGIEGEKIKERERWIKRERERERDESKDGLNKGNGHKDGEKKKFQKNEVGEDESEI